MSRERVSCRFMNTTKRERVGGGAGEPRREEIKLGLDVHARQVTLCRQVGGCTPQPVQKMTPEGFLDWIDRLTSEGHTIVSCYEAGACGYWLHRELIRRGVTNFVIAPQRLDAGARRQKTDRLDARALVDRLERYLRGNRRAFNVVTVPTEVQEQRRALVRHREQLLQDRRRAEARGRAAMLAQGIVVRGQWWRPRRWLELKPTLPGWLCRLVESWQQRALALDGEERALRQELEALAPVQLPIGVGALSWVVLECEVRDWQRFTNRRQIASYTGLCPGIHQSNGRGREGSINRCGNPTVRYTLVEMAWRLLRWQPGYGPLQRLRAALLSSRAKRRLLVAAARRLAIDLWRLATQQTTPESIGLKVAPH
jgi:transposase